MMERFDEKGRMYIPLSWHKRDSPIENARFVITEAYCQNGHSLMDHDCEVNGFPGIRLAFTVETQRGAFVISAVEGDFTKVMLSGFLSPGQKLLLECPVCGVSFPVLMGCGCTGGGNLVAIGLTPKFDFNNAIVFCDVVGCENGSFVKSGEIIRHMRL
ncbi:MAG TPA: hypothetical protein PLG43_02050 [Spirochaetia bacterium]|jgi:hypothetical protein|nr:hypothetical protein [Spirochaetia bacterium]